MASLAEYKGFTCQISISPMRITFGRGMNAPERKLSGIPAVPGTLIANISSLKATADIKPTPMIGGIVIRPIMNAKIGLPLPGNPKK